MQKKNKKKKTNVFEYFLLLFQNKLTHTITFKQTW